jgi:hypothetical protein
MTERVGIGLVLLVIAVAHLMTDVVRLALEVSPRPGINDPAPTAYWAFDHPRAMPANRTFYRLPLDFSINQPPWCPACRIAARHETRRQDGW